MERDNLVALRDFIGDEEFPPSFPSTWGLYTLLVNVAFKSDEDISKLLVRCTPCINYRGSDSWAQNLLDRGKQMFANNWILIGRDT